MKRTEFSEYSQFEVEEISESEGNAYYRPQGTVESFNEAVGDSFDEVIEDFLPPVAEGCNEFGQILVAGEVGFENPRREEPGGFLSAVDLLEDTAELLFEQIQGSQLRAQLQDLVELIPLQG